MKNQFLEYLPQPGCLLQLSLDHPPIQVLRMRFPLHLLQRLELGLLRMIGPGHYLV